MKRALQMYCYLVSLLLLAVDSLSAVELANFENQYGRVQLKYHHDEEEEELGDILNLLLGQPEQVITTLHSPRFIPHRTP